MPGSAGAICGLIVVSDNFVIRASVLPRPPPLLAAAISRDKTDRTRINLLGGTCNRYDDDYD